MATAPKKKAGKPSLTPAQKKEREELLKNETKAEKFKRLATPRVTAAIKTIRLIGNCAGPGYESTPEQITTIRGLLNDAVTDTLKRFEAKAGKTEIKVSL